MKRRELWFYIFSLLGTFFLAGLAQFIYPLVPAAYQAAVVLTMAQAGPLVALIFVSLFSKDWSSWKRMNWKHTGKGVLGMSLLSFCLPAAITASGALILSLAGVKYVSGGYTVLSAAVLLTASVIGCIFEEIGWRGYLLPALLEKHSLFVSAVFSGLLWGAWHFLKLVTFGPAGYLLFIILITELTIIMLLPSAAWLLSCLTRTPILARKSGPRRHFESNTLDLSYFGSIFANKDAAVDTMAASLLFACACLSQCLRQFLFQTSAR